MDIVIAGGGVAGLEALLALRALAGDRVRLTLVAPDPDFTYRPLAVAEPFSLGHAARVPLQRMCDDVGAGLVLAAVAGVDDASGEVRLDDRATLGFDALLVAPGARPVAGVPGATTWWPGDSEAYGGLLRDIEEGYTQSLAIVVPPGAVWPLPVYELALMTAGEAAEMGRTDLAVTIVTPERTPLSLFGEDASRTLAEELRWAGIGLRTGVVGVVEPGGLRLAPGGERVAAERVFAVPRLVGPGVAGLPCDDEGFILATDDARVNGRARTWAAGDGVASPVKFGGIATHQARRAAAAIARAAGVEDAPDPGEPALQGRLLAGRRSRRLTGRGAAAPLWWPAGKIAGEHLPRWLAEHGIAPGPAQAPSPPATGVEVHRPLSALRGAEAQYLYDLARQFRQGAPA